MRIDRRVTIAWLAAAATGVAAARDERYLERPASADGIGRVYMGREIAGVMGWQGAAWLEREEREREERTDLLVRSLALTPGMVVADIGAGTGYLSSNDQRLHFGLGSASSINTLRIEWPSGAVELLKDLAADKLYTVEEGKGVTLTQPLQPVPITPTTLSR